MGEYILRPRQHAFESGYDYHDSNHQTTAAYDSSTSTYWLNKNSNVRYPLKMFYDFDFSSIPANEFITDAKYRLTYESSIGFNGVKSSSRITYADPVAPYIVEALADFPAQTTKASYAVELTDTVDYINQNMASLRSGAAKLGFYTPMRYSYGGIDSKLYDINLVLTTAAVGTNLYIGDKNVASAYLGNTKLTGIYLGNTKLL